MNIPEKWQERINSDELNQGYRVKDWVRYRVTYVNKRDEIRTTEITASSKVNAATLVSALGEVRLVTPLREEE